MAIAIVPLAGPAPALLRVRGATALERVLAALAAVPGVEQIVVVPQVEITLPAPQPRVRLNPARAGRLSAIRAALEAVGPAGPVLVHDADQSLVTPDWLSAVLAATDAHPVVATVVPVKAASKRVVEGTIEASFPRERLFRLLGPRAFAAGVLAAVVADGPEDGDEVRAALAAGVPVAPHAVALPNVRVTGPVSAEAAGRLAADDVR